MKQKLCIISNESISKQKSGFYCDNVDLKSIPEELNKFYDLDLIARESKIERSKKIEIKNIFVHYSFFSYLLNILKSFKRKYNTYFIISLTPITFLSALILILYKKKFYLYLRSDGFEEYRKKIGIIGHLIYKIMFWLVCPKAKLITCNKKLLKGMSGDLVRPSQLTKKWKVSITKANLEKINLLYIGRIKVEKGIFSLIKMLEKSKLNFSLSILSNEPYVKIKLNQEFINIIKKSNHDSLINIYDNHNIFILPSYTEAYSQVIDESLSRGRPAIIFNDIADIIFSYRKGVFACDRDLAALENTIEYIIKNYSEISKEISKNHLPQKDNFINDLRKILEN